MEWCKSVTYAPGFLYFFLNRKGKDMDRTAVNKLRLKMLALESFLAKEFDIENEILWDALLEAGVPEDLL